MKKKAISLTLVLALLLTLAVPAAAQSADERLAAVTAQVKAALGLNTEAYEEFYGFMDEGVLANTWYLEWYGEGRSLNITATEAGKVVDYYYHEDSTESSGSFAPKFPEGSRETARAAAEQFLDKVLGSNETAVLEDSGSNRLGAATYRFHGDILINGLPAGLSVSVGVRCADNVVTSFYRDDLNGMIVGSVPSSKAAVTAGAAGTTLRETLAMRLEYVLAEDSEDQAVLRYVPEYGDEYYVDAQSGRLVNLTELAQNIDSPAGGATGDTSDDAMAESGAAEDAGSLTDAEQAGVGALADVLDRDALDKAVRAISALGLKNYTLSTASYEVTREEELKENPDAPAVTAALRYSRQMEDATWRRTVTVDAKTGALIRVSSSMWNPEEGVRETVNAGAAQAKAEGFLTDQCGWQFEKTALYDSTDALESDWSAAHSFRFAQQENGYFFPESSIRVGVDATDGSICEYYNYFIDGATFDSAEGVLTMDEAIDAWMGTYTVTLGYVQVPTAINGSHPKYETLMDYGIGYLYKLVLGYALEREDYLLGIDAKTGEPVQPAWAAEEEDKAYGDVEGHWAQAQIERLAEYGVGFYGEAFLPNAAMTQRDMVALLASTEGFVFDPAEEGAADDLYEFAYNAGILKREERNDGAVLTRAAAVKLILDATGYGPVAQLQGIYRTAFADDRSIPSAYYGYVALAQGLGIVSGAPGNRFLPDSGTTRAQGAVMLYNLMNR